ncbi:MAG: UvrD-helicase domain-containing protein, partial [Bacteroidales bacterium]|nr:UvrD-helicase domain-containing protein [Bacteroidales bacterium]
FLLDEFQDTSALQWNNLLPLIENSLSENHLSLLVGDSKQSIYRWRGSDVNQLSQLPELVHHNDDLSKGRELLLKANYFEQQLLANYRSDGAIVNFNNSLFHFIHQSAWLPLTYKKVYAEVEQSVADEKKDFGLVDLILLESLEEELLNKSVLDFLSTAIKEGYNYEDITILVRKNSQATAFADLLIENQIPVISSVALRISSSSKVQFLLSLFRMIEQPKEKLFKIEIIRYLLQSNKINQFSIEELISILLHFKVDEKGFNTDFFHWLSSQAYFIDFNQINKGDVYELAEYFLRLFDLREPDPYVQFFLDTLHEFKRTPFNQLKDFLDWWLEHETKLFIELPGGLNAVTIQTVFKAKGLQYPVVIFPVPDKSLKTDQGKNRSWINPNIAELEQLKSFPFALHSLKDTLLTSAYQQEVEAQMLDDINLFYVALTRAKNRMF